MFSTCKGREGVEDANSCRSPTRRLKLTSMTRILPEDTSSSGKPPDSELWERFRTLRCCSPVRFPRDRERCPSRRFEASEILETILFGLQVIPSHLQQSMLSCHEAARPPSCESPARNWRRECCSCFVQELVGEAKEIRSTRERPSKGNGTHSRKKLLVKICQDTMARQYTRRSYRKVFAIESNHQRLSQCVHTAKWKARISAIFCSLMDGAGLEGG